MPDQLAAAVVDEAEQLCIRQVELLVRQPLGHLQPAAFDLGSGDQGAGIGRQALFDDLLEGQAEGALQCGQQCQHEQRGQARGAEHRRRRSDMAPVRRVRTRACSRRQRRLIGSAR